MIILKVGEGQCTSEITVTASWGCIIWIDCQKASEHLCVCFCSSWAYVFISSGCSNIVSKFTLLVCIYLYLIVLNLLCMCASCVSAHKCVYVLSHTSVYSVCVSVSSNSRWLLQLFSSLFNESLLLKVEMFLSPQPTH